MYQFYEYILLDAADGLDRLNVHLLLKLFIGLFAYMPTPHSSINIPTRPPNCDNSFYFLLSLDPL